MEYLLFIGGGVMGAIIAAIAIYRKTGDAKIYKPQELEDGNYVIQKPADEFIDGIEHDGVVMDIKTKTNARLPDPKGEPTVRP